MTPRMFLIIWLPHMWKSLNNLVRIHMHSSNIWTRLCSPTSTNFVRFFNTLFLTLIGTRRGDHNRAFSARIIHCVQPLVPQKSLYAYLFAIDTSIKMYIPCFKPEVTSHKNLIIIYNTCYWTNNSKELNLWYK
jgi:hypothetical protein